MATLVPRYTAAEVRRFDDPRLRFEVIRGQLLVSPAPGAPHQVAVARLTHWLVEYVERHQLGVVLPGPFEVVFTEDSAVQPDLLVVLAEQRPRLTRRRLNGAPALVVEIISFSSKRTDRLEKRDLYLAEGVPEYWIVDLEQRHVELWRPALTAPEIFTDRLTWRPVAGHPPLVINLPALFQAADLTS